MAGSFISLLGSFDLDTLEAHQGPVVGLWPDYRMAYQNPAWFAFASANDSETGDLARLADRPVFDGGRYPKSSSPSIAGPSTDALSRGSPGIMTTSAPATLFCDIFISPPTLWCNGRGF